MHLRKVIVMLMGCCLASNVFSQERIDSLEHILKANLSSSEKLIATNELAEEYWETDPDQTLTYARKALALAQSLNNRDQEAYALLNLCQGYLYNDVYDQALQYGLQALQIRTELGDQQELALVLSILGWLYYDMENPDKALEYHLQAHDIYRQSQNISKIGNALNGIGLIHIQKGNYRTALNYLNESLKVADSTNHVALEAIVRSNMGECYLGLEQYDRAAQMLLQSIALNQQMTDPYLNTISLNRIARAWLAKKEFAKAEGALEEAYQKVKGLSDAKVYLMSNYEIRSSLYEALGTYQKSLTYYKLYNELRGEIISEEKNQKLLEIRAAHEEERTMAQSQIEEQQQELKIIRYQIILGSFIFVLIVGLLIFDRIRSYRKNRQLIYKAKQALRSANRPHENP